MSLTLVSDLHQLTFDDDKETLLTGVPIVPNPNMSAAPSNVEHIGTVEVVVLRCYPMDRPTKSGLSQPVPILKSGQHNKAQQGVSTPIPSPVDSSQDNSSSDGNDPQSGFGSLFDGTGGCVPLHTSSFNFGGDASWDNTRQEWDNDGRDSWQQQADPQQWNNVSAMNSTSTVRQGQATDGQWDNRVSTCVIDMKLTAITVGSPHTPQAYASLDLEATMAASQAVDHLSPRTYRMSQVLI